MFSYTLLARFQHNFKWKKLLSGFLFSCWNNLCVVPSMPKEHQGYLKQAVQRLSQHNLTINIQKYTFPASLNYLPLVMKYQPKSLRHLTWKFLSCNPHRQLIENTTATQLAIFSTCPANQEEWSLISKAAVGKCKKLLSYVALLKISNCCPGQTLLRLPGVLLYRRWSLYI